MLLLLLLLLKMLLLLLLCDLQRMLQQLLQLLRRLRTREAAVSVGVERRQRRLNEWLRLAELAARLRHCDCGGGGGRIRGCVRLCSLLLRLLKLLQLLCRLRQEASGRRTYPRGAATRRLKPRQAGGSGSSQS